MWRREKEIASRPRWLTALKWKFLLEAGLEFRFLSWLPIVKHDDELVAIFIFLFLFFHIFQFFLLLLLFFFVVYISPLDASCPNCNSIKTSVFSLRRFTTFARWTRGSLSSARTAPSSISGPLFANGGSMSIALRRPTITIWTTRLASLNGKSFKMASALRLTAKRQSPACRNQRPNQLTALHHQSSSSLFWSGRQSNVHQTDWQPSKLSWPRPLILDRKRTHGQFSFVLFL